MNYPIWNIVTSCIYKANKSYGVRETGEVEIRICNSRQGNNDKPNNYRQSTRLKLWPISNALLWWEGVVLRSYPFFLCLTLRHQGLVKSQLDRRDKQAI